MTTFEACNGTVVPMLDWWTRDLVVIKDGTGPNTVPTPDTKTKVEGMKIDNNLSDLRMHYITQEFDFDIIKFNILAGNTFSKLFNFRDYCKSLQDCIL